MERCLSGLKDMLGKHAWEKSHREFESRPLRQKSKSHFEAEMGSRRRRDTNASPQKKSESKSLGLTSNGYNTFEVDLIGTNYSMVWKHS